MKLELKHIALAALASLVLGLPCVNIYHHMELPVLNKYRIQTHWVFQPLHFPPLHRQTDIRLELEVHENTFYMDIATTLENALPSDVIIFHLSGYGGYGQTMMTLIDQIKKTKAHTIMDVEGPVYSADSYLAVSGNELIMEPYTYMHFHYSTILNLDCSQQTGTDRGVSNQEHCQVIKDANMEASNKLIFDISLLTIDEKMSILTGHDVIIQSDEYYKRIATQQEENK